MSLLRSVAFAFLSVLLVSVVMLSGCPAPTTYDDGSWYATEGEAATEGQTVVVTEGQAAEGEGEGEWWSGMEGEGEGWDSREGEGESDTPIPVPATPVEPELVAIAATTFTMGATVDETGEAIGSEVVATPDESPRHDVALSAYSIGKYEVTNAEYASVLNWALAQTSIKGLLVAKDGKPYAGGDLYYAIEGGVVPVIMTGQESCQILYSGTSFAVRTRQGLSMEDHPVIMVSWYGAALYCNWLNLSLSKVAPYNTATWQIQAGTDRYTLPTEAQWECAAAWSNPAGQIPRRYIFAFARDVLEPAQANYTEWTAPEGESTSLVPVFCNPLELRQFPYTTPTGYYNGENLTKDSLSPLGCRDMTGNATEWCEDRYALYTASETPQTNPRGPLTGVNRIARGGSWYSSPEVCRVSNRLMYEPDEMLAEVGFRVAR